MGFAPLPQGARPLVRSVDGVKNDLNDESMGSVGAPFGRNVPLNDTTPYDVLTPNPRTVSLELMTREQFQPAKTLNVLAAAWLQFEVVRPHRERARRLRVGQQGDRDTREGVSVRPSPSPRA